MQVLPLQAAFVAASLGCHFFAKKLGTTINIREHSNTCVILFAIATHVLLECD